MLTLNPHLGSVIKFATFLLCKGGKLPFRVGTGISLPVLLNGRGFQLSVHVYVHGGQDTSKSRVSRFGGSECVVMVSLDLS